jgi:hypothetical protein
VIFGLLVHPGTQTFFLWQQHAFGSQADSSSDNGEDEAEDEEDVEDSGSGGVSLQQRAAGKDFWQSNFAKRLAFGSACKRPFLSFGRGICE